MLEDFKANYDYIIIDCSPSLGLITVNALTAADSVVIPVQAEYFALEGISKLLNTIRIIKSKLNKSLEIEGFLLTMYDARLRLANQIYEELKGHFGDMVFNTVIRVIFALARLRATACLLSYMTRRVKGQQATCDWLRNYCHETNRIYGINKKKRIGTRA